MKITKILAALLFSAILLSLSWAADVRPYDLRCDLMHDPLGVDSAPPHLSWKLESCQRGARQTAWQVLVASTAEALQAEKADVWDSGKRPGDDQVNILFAGSALPSASQVFWKVRVWDGAGEASDWSAPATWTMGVVRQEDWKAKWITDDTLLKWIRGKVGYHSLPTTDQKEPKWVGVDLGKSMPIESVRFYIVRQIIEEAQGLPLRFKVEVSDTEDFKDAKVIADYTKQNFPYTNTAHKTTVPTFDVEGGSVSGRYVRMISTLLKPDVDQHYLAFFQMEVLSGGKNVAKGARVIAKDSMEEGRWGKDALVDGLDTRGTNPDENSTLTARRDFAVKPGLRRALAYISGLGHYELTINGRKVGEDLLAPGWTTYQKTALYDTHDVTALLKAGGKNAAGVVLAGGMYNVRAGRYVKFESLFRPLMVICQIRLEYADGSVEFVGTDANWKLTHGGPITFSNMFGGEDYDARREMAGWDSAGFNERGWKAATVVDGPGGALRGVSHASPPLRPFETLTPLRVTTLRPGVLVYDLGQNASVMPRLRVKGPAGTSVRIIPGELLNEDGSVSRASCSRGKGEAWWEYTLAGRNGVEEWFPKFFYQGSRYWQVELSPTQSGGKLPEVDYLEGVVVHTSSAPSGDFSCSNEMFNRVRTLIRWAQRSNLVSVITDCPHREKLGWLEQYHLNGPSLRYEFDLSRLYTKTFGDMADAQDPSGLVPDIAPEFVVFYDGFRDSPEWGSAFILAAWQQYEWTGDDAALVRYYPQMCRYADYLGRQAKDYIVPGGLGDWYDIGPKGPSRSQLTPIPLTATATYYADLTTLAAVAERLGKKDDAKRFAAEAVKVRDAYNKKFYNQEKGIYATGSQCANAISLVFGLAEPGERERILDAIVRDVREKSLTAGDVGYRYLIRALADGGRSDVIYEMNNQAVRPGYGYQLAQGATSLAETWDAGIKWSQNHFMLGQIMEWFYHDLAGIAADPAKPGYKNVIIRPQPVEGINWAQARYESPYGDIVSIWKRDAGRFVLDVTIPTGATATVSIPAVAANSEIIDSYTGRPVIAGRDGVKARRAEAGSVVLEIEPGHYIFSTPQP